MTTEIWKDIVYEGFEGLYQVSNLGRIKSLARPSNRYGKVVTLKEKILNPAVCKVTGYKNFSMISLNRVKKQVVVHREVAIAFCPGRTEDKKIVNHIDAIKINNEASNLEWCTYKENSRHASNMGLLKGTTGEDHWAHKLTEMQIVEIRLRYIKYGTKGNSGRDLAKEFQVSDVTISNVINDKNWKNVG